MSGGFAGGNKWGNRGGRQGAAAQDLCVFSGSCMQIHTNPHVPEEQDERGLISA